MQIVFLNSSLMLDLICIMEIGNVPRSRITCISKFGKCLALKGRWRCWCYCASAAYIHGAENHSEIVLKKGGEVVAGNPWKGTHGNELWLMVV